MSFFANPIKVERTGIKLRDAIIDYCRYKQSKGEQLTSKVGGRIIFE